MANLGDFVVVCQEHGQILRLLDGRRLRHFSEKLGSSAKKTHLVSFQRAKSVHKDKRIAETSRDCITDIEYNNLANKGKTGFRFITSSLHLMHSSTCCYGALLLPSVCLDNRIFTVKEQVVSFSVSEYRL